MWLRWKRESIQEQLDEVDATEGLSEDKLKMQMALKRCLWVLDGVLNHGYKYEILIEIAEFYGKYDFMVPTTYNLAPLMSIRSTVVKQPATLLELKKQDKRD